MKRFSDVAEKDLEWLDKMVDEDVLNNSAWNYRYYLLNHLGMNVMKEFE